MDHSLKEKMAKSINNITKCAQLSELSYITDSIRELSINHTKGSGLWLFHSHGYMTALQDVLMKVEDRRKAIALEAENASNSQSA